MKGVDIIKRVTVERSKNLRMYSAARGDNSQDAPQIGRQTRETGRGSEPPLGVCSGRSGIPPERASGPLAPAANAKASDVSLEAGPLLAEGLRTCRVGHESVTLRIGDARALQTSGSGRVGLH